MSCRRWAVAIVYRFDRLGRGSVGTGGARAIKSESLSSITRSVGVEGDGMVLIVNHMWWYRLRERVVSIKCMVWRWVVGYRTIFNDKGSAIRINIDRSIWITNVSIVIEYCVDSAGKVIVRPRSNVWDVVRIIWYYCGRLEGSILLGRLVNIRRRCADTVRRWWVLPSYV